MLRKQERPSLPTSAGCAQLRAGMALALVAQAELLASGENVPAATASGTIGVWALALATAGAAGWFYFRQRRLARELDHAQTELAEQRQMLAAVVERCPLACTVLELWSDGTARLQTWNSEAARLFGLGAMSADGQTLEQLQLTEDARLYWQEVISRSQQVTAKSTWEHLMAGAQRRIETALIPLSRTGTATRRVCVVAEDITQRELFAHEVTESRRLRSLGELVGGLAHEFNNLLTPIIVNTNLLQLDYGADTRLQGELGLIEQSATRAASLTRRLLSFGRKTSEGAVAVPLAEAVKSCLALLQPTADRRIEWEKQVAPDLPSLWINPVDLNQIVFTLLAQARDSLMEKLTGARSDTWVPRLRVIVQALEPTAYAPRPADRERVLLGWQKLTVEDNGPGMEQAEAEQMFASRLSGKRHEKGAGLGLEIVWLLVTDAGGTVSVEATPGVGTKFNVVLPCWQRELGAQENVSLGEVAGKFGIQQVLLVEDDVLVARATGALLARLGLKVTTLRDGREAWEQLAAGKLQPDLLLLDVNMPRMNGVELVRRVREIRFAGQIVVMSGRIEGEELRELEALRVDRIMTKPFLQDDFVVVLGELAQQRRAGRGE